MTETCPSEQRNFDRAASRTGLSISPGRLVKLDEYIEFSAGETGSLTINTSLTGGAAEVFRATLKPGELVRWSACAPGMYVAEFTTETKTLKRPLAVVEKGWSVCQITVGAFTAEDFAETVHEAGAPVNYYVSLSRGDDRWLKYEQDFGDEIYPHVMARDVGVLDAKLDHVDANWDSLSVGEIVDRLVALQQWWVGRGFQHLEQIATYTPCNQFVEACRQVGIRVIHSLVPEQNWSDGEWAINHWGMPTSPFWIAKDDFRKATSKTPDGVLGVTMNHYHVLLPHLTKWGDFVLSPSHFTRWIRSADSGAESMRFLQFLRDTLHGWASLSDDPFFFVAGFEFGRTFGTANMTDYNRRGLERLIGLARDGEKIVFATGLDVAGYYSRHLTQHPETVFRQRDNWVGCRVNGKPGQAGDSVVVERADYKAVIREGEKLPFFYYDYRTAWSYAARDTDAPRDWASDIRQEIKIEIRGNEMSVTAERPLQRRVPVALWDWSVVRAPFAVASLPVLDDQRRVTLVEVPAGWSGKEKITLLPCEAPMRRRDDLWKMQTFGEGKSLHTYLHLDAALTKEIDITVHLSKGAIIENVAESRTVDSPGPVALRFGPLQEWYRFWQCGIEDVSLPSDIEPILRDAVLSHDWNEEVIVHQNKIDKLVGRLISPDEKIIYQAVCGAKLPLGTRSRAASWDAVIAGHDGAKIEAAEKGDGAIAFGPGRSFWYHPRNLPVQIDGLADGVKRSVILHTFDPLGLNVRYRIEFGKRKVGDWDIPTSSYSPAAFFKSEIHPTDLDSAGRLHITIGTDQQQILHWWKDKGFIAALQTLWILES